jgi:beta-glucanase (GH16 family)
MKDYAALLLPLVTAVFCTCGTSPGTMITRPVVYTIKEPLTGCYPQGLYKNPHKQNTTAFELFLQTLEWSPTVEKTFAADTQYTAKLTLTPASSKYTFNGVKLEDVQGLPVNGVETIFCDTSSNDMVINVVFNKTAPINAEPELLFYDDFDGNELDGTKWAVCPNWDRQGRSTWDPGMVSVSDGYLRLGFKRDAALGKTKTLKREVSDNWIRAGAVRSMTADFSRIFFANTFGYYETRVKIPKISGMWGAFWLMSPTQWIMTDGGKIGTEIDIVETIANPKNSFNAALHWDGYDNRHKSTGSNDVKVPGIDIYDGEFHTFALDWSPGEYIFYVDGIEFWRCDGSAKYNNSSINHNPNYIKLTVEGADWAGPLPADFTEDEMLVDYVKVYNQPISKGGGS